MTWWEAVFLGLVQALTEFLPISSSAHLRIVGELLPGGGDPGAAFTAVTQIGTETAVILYFRKDIARICVAWWRAITGATGTSWRERLGSQDADARMGWWIALGSVPIVVLGLTFQDSIKGPFRNLYLVAMTLALFAIFLSFADKFGAKRRRLDQLTGKHAIIYGFAQAMALIPGVSRSGGTITAGLLMGYTREAAARYSFLLAIPAVMGSGFQQLFASLDEFALPGTPSLAATALATLVAFVAGYGVIIWFLRIVSTYSYQPFVIYRLVLAAVVVALLVAGVLTPEGGVLH
ncbi:undecaprenyl-diphosphate phosphatase [Cellulomonas bogoriensis]|uniref:Undecaprenyl-diphosphatase n=1 Tax=Cellulomonas bogoriensis 69B4 = DSM 16987 TaxID=1386082 RepID=A0A0A0C155_9CELL|nr:undecaprenyl-diphosphate phosphatase [Cellulomonas bogoriensis]KGM14368.1 UDP-diphosphatase [Cellulomonas bogoriensis 69B4 = DSM 16987]